MSLHSLSFVVPMPILLELSIGVCVCVCVCAEKVHWMVWIFFLKNNKKKHKQMGLILFMPVANYKADP